MMRLIIQLDAGWVLKHRSAEVLPSSIVSQTLREMGIEVISESFRSVSANLSVEKNALEDVKKQIFLRLNERLNEQSQQLDELVLFQLEDIPVSAPPAEQTPEPEKPKVSTEPQPKQEAAQEDMLVEIEKLMGAGELAKLCRSISGLAPLLKSRGLSQIVTNRSYLFSIDDGSGLSTALKLLQQLLAQQGLFEFRGDPVELKLAAPGGNEDPLKEMAATVTKSRQKLICIDIRDWMDKAASPEFRDFLLKLLRNNQYAVYVFRVPYLERGILERIAAAIADVLLLDTVSFVPLDLQQLQALAEKDLGEYGFTATPEAWELFQHRLTEEKSDGRFYGFKTVKKVVEEMVLLKFQTILAGGKENTVIEAADLPGFTQDTSNVTASEMLDRLVGIDAIRGRLYEIVSQIEFARKNSSVQAPTMHMRFVGNPGTGKTTVARIMGKLLKERGILSKGYFLEHNGGDFLGMYVGHTAPKTLALCRDAYGSVLFIDEAYTLADANYASGGGYAKEAIDTLIAQMENHRDDMVVIMAGYPKEMERLMALNPGLEGRMPYELVFPNYSPEELFGIFLRMVENNGFLCGNDVTEAVHSYFLNLDNRVLTDSDFSNARFVRNLFERTWSKTVMRAQLDGTDPKTIVLEDFLSAAKEDTKSIGAKQSKHTRPGYRLGLV